MKLGTGLQGTLLRLYGVEEFSSTRWLLHTLGNVIPIMYENDKISQSATVAAIFTYYAIPYTLQSNHTFKIPKCKRHR